MIEKPEKPALKLDSLTGLRAIAIALVFWHHISPVYDAHSAGMVGVSLFYLLSGFVMAWTDREDDTAWLFYRRRFARIVPTYVVAAVIVLVWLVSRGRFELHDLLAFTLMQSWVPEPAVYFAMSAVFWSLSVEVFFYVMFPLVRLVTRRLGRPALTLVGAAMIIVSASIALSGVGRSPQEVQWFVTVFPPSRLPEFVLGVVMGTLVARGWRPRVPVIVPVIMCAGAIWYAGQTWYSLSRYAITLIPFALLILSLANSDLNGKRTFASLQPMVKVGIWSYAFYLIHATIIEQGMVYVRAAGIPRTLGVVLIFAVSIAAAWLLHVCVERPAERALRPTGRARLDTEASFDTR